MIVELVLMAVQVGMELLNPSHWSDRRERRALRKAERTARRLTGSSPAADGPAA
jgi:hypothetical protein